MIVPNGNPDERIHADASSFHVKGSYLNVRKGIKVEFQRGKNAEGKEVAVNVTGPNREGIDANTKVISKIRAPAS